MGMWVALSMAFRWHRQVNIQHRAGPWLAFLAHLPQSCRVSLLEQQGEDDRKKIFYRFVLKNNFSLEKP